MLANIFSNSTACIFIILTGFFSHKNLIWMKFILLIFFSFMDHAFGIISKNFTKPKSQWFSAKCTIAWWSTFKSMIHFQLIFVWGLKFRLMFMIFDYECPIAPAPLVKNTAFLHWTAFCPLVKISWLYLCRFMPEFSILFNFLYVSTNITILIIVAI